MHRLYKNKGMCSICNSIISWSIEMAIFCKKRWALIFPKIERKP